MKKTNTPTPKNTKWYLVYDGKDHKVVNALKEYETLKVVVIELSPQQAASYLFMKQTSGNN